MARTNDLANLLEHASVDPASCARALARRPLCTTCRGRLVARVGRGYENAERGAALHAFLEARGIECSPAAAATADDPCAWCRGVLERLPALHDQLERVAREREFATFLVGSRLPGWVDALERELDAEGFRATLEPLRRELNRVLGAELERRHGVRCDHGDPEVHFRVQPYRHEIQADWRPVWLFGRYNKYRRDLPQTRWSCRVCRGRGCAECAGTGFTYTDSVEGLAGAAFRELLGADDAILHGSGREDVDVRMLGTGRPFVLELVAPRRRSLAGALDDWSAARAGVRLRDLRLVDRDVVRRIKGAAFPKTYVAVMEVTGEDPGLAAVRAAAHAFLAEPIEQATPQRVAHRRADRTRTRRVFAIRVRRLGAGRYAVRLRGSAGLYIKELIHGDEGRTRPSFAERLGRPCSCTHLDVVRIHDEPYSSRS